MRIVGRILVSSPESAMLAAFQILSSLAMLLWCFSSVWILVNLFLDYLKLEPENQVEFFLISNFLSLRSFRNYYCLVSQTTDVIQSSSSSHQSRSRGRLGSELGTRKIWLSVSKVNSTIADIAKLLSTFHLFSSLNLFPVFKLLPTIELLLRQSK